MITFRICARSAERAAEDRAQLYRFSVQTIRFCYLTQRPAMSHIEPEFGFVHLFKDDSELRDEFGARTSNASCAIVGGNGCDRSLELVNESENIEGKLNCPLFQLFTLSAHRNACVAQPVPISIL